MYLYIRSQLITVDVDFDVQGVYLTGDRSINLNTQTSTQASLVED